MIRQAMYYAFSLVVVIGLMACGDLSDAEISQRLEGDWRLVLEGCDEPLGDLAVGDIYTEYSFEADGTMEERIWDMGETAYVQGTWQVDAGRVEIHFSSTVLCLDGEQEIECYHTGHAGEQVSAEVTFPRTITYESYTSSGIVTRRGSFAKLTGDRSDADPTTGCMWFLEKQ